MSVEFGRFWSMDDYEGANRDPLSLHKYLYTKGSPLNSRDPSGNVSLVEIQVATSIVSTLTDLNATSGFALFDTIESGALNAGTNVAISSAAGVAVVAIAPLVRAFAKSINGFTKIVTRAVPGGVVGLSRIHFRTRMLVFPHEVLTQVMRKIGLTQKGYESGHLLPRAIFQGIPPAEGLAIPMLEGVATKNGDHWGFHRKLEVAWHYYNQAKGRNPTAREYVRYILPDALMNMTHADISPSQALALAEACEGQVLMYYGKLDFILERLYRNTKQ